MLGPIPLWVVLVLVAGVWNSSMSSIILCSALCTDTTTCIVDIERMTVCSNVTTAHRYRYGRTVV